MVEQKNLGGRPSVYNEELQKKADDYLDFPLFETISKEVVVKDQIQVINIERPNSIPTVAGLALHLGISRETVYAWAKDTKKSQFSDTFNRLKAKQHEFLVYHGLTRGYDSSFAKFMAVNVTDLRDKVTQENTGTVEIVIDNDDADL